MTRMPIMISAAALLIALVHVVWPALAIDTVTAILLIVAALPWLTPLVKSVEVPGLGMIEMQASGLDPGAGNQVAERIREEADIQRSVRANQAPQQAKNADVRTTSDESFYRGARAGINAVADLVEDLTVTVGTNGTEERRSIGRELAPKLRYAAQVIKPEDAS